MAQARGGWVSYDLIASIIHGEIKTLLKSCSIRQAMTKIVNYTKVGVGMCGNAYVCVRET